MENSPTNKKEFITEFGRLLIDGYGKKQYYSPEEVNETKEKSSWTDYFDFT